MKKVLILFIFIISNLSIKAQTFQKVYGDTIADQGAYFISVNDSSFHLLTLGYHYSSPGFFRVLKTNQYGDSLISNNIQTSSNNNLDYCINSENEFVLVSCKSTWVAAGQYVDTLFIDRIDTDGNLISTWSYPDTMSFVGSRILRTSDNGYLLSLGNWNSQFNANILFMKIDSLGNLIWKKNELNYTVSQESTIDLMETSDHFYIAEILQASGSNWAGLKLMMKLDTMGNVVWTDTLTNGYITGIQQQMIASDSGYIYIDNTSYNSSTAFQSRISLVDTSGNLVWSKIYYNTNVLYKRIIANNSGGIYLCGTLENLAIDNNEIIITKLDNNADSVSTFSLGYNPGYEFPIYFKQMDDSRIGILGSIQPRMLANVSERNIYFAVCDTLGNVTTEIGNVFSEEDDGSILYPNPTNGRFNISSSQFTIKNLEIFNALGEKVYSEKLNTNSISLNLFLAKGIYFIQLKNGEKSIIKKLAIQ